jgi:hypothetical protein
LPLDEAMERVAAEAGTSFDPDVVRALQARYRELEARAKATHTDPQPSLSGGIKISRGGAPAAGFEAEPAAGGAQTSGVAGPCVAPPREIVAGDAGYWLVLLAVGGGHGSGGAPNSTRG